MASQDKQRDEGTRVDEKKVKETFKPTHLVFVLPIFTYGENQVAM